MVIGTGIDIIEVNKISAASRNKNFMRSVFTGAEQEAFSRVGFDPKFVAGTYAAKEAVAKALAVEFQGMEWQTIEILNDTEGNPYPVLKRKALERMNELSATRVHISISHIKEMAVAQAIVED